MKFYKNRKIQITCIVSLLILLAGGITGWNRYASTTRIALVNFQPFQATSIVKANLNPNIRFKEVSVDELSKLKQYDFVLGFGMGMQITADQRAELINMADNGLPVLIYAATNPDNNICSLDSINREAVSAYLGNGNRKNYQSLANYVRINIDQKKFFITQADSVQKMQSDVLYHLDDTKSFKTVADYENYLKANNFYKEGGARIAMVGGLNDPFSGNRDNIDSLITSFMQAGMNIYPVSSMMKRLDFLKEIQPDAVLYFAHGRMSMGQPDAAVEWLKTQNIPVFAPLSILQARDKWEEDQMGMFGGFMSQSVVVPELDGTIYPYVVSSQEVDSEGLYIFKAIPERLAEFTKIVKNYTDLSHKKNENKKVAIYYFKGAGQDALTAQGLETVPSLYNLLKELRKAGYKVENLPATVSEFEKLLMSQGAVFNTYAAGAFDEYLKKGNPALVSKTDYEQWTSKSLPKDLYKEVTDTYGEAPGQFMAVQSNDTDYLAVARIELGNIVLLPQPMPALGDDEFAIVHGAKSPPPHTYIAAYLWSEYAFGADALIHFGAHGSLEFTPSKQVALSSYDWPDRLVGTIPHFYYYTIANVGESIMAKRRSYATLVSYLTPPFMENETRGTYRRLMQRIGDYYKTEGAQQEKIALEIKAIAMEMGLNRELRLDTIPGKVYTEEEIERLENFAEELANEKMMGQLYITGVPYSNENIRSTVLAMATDPIAYSLAALDKLNGKITDAQMKNNAWFTRNYLDPAAVLVKQVLDGRPVNDALVALVAKTTTEEIKLAKSTLTPARRMGMPGASRPASAKAKADSASQKSAEMSAPGSVEEMKKLMEENGDMDMSKVIAAHVKMMAGGGKPNKSEMMAELAKAGAGGKDKMQEVHSNLMADAKQAGSNEISTDHVNKKVDQMSGATRKAEAPTAPKMDKDRARALVEIERTLLAINSYYSGLKNSPEAEMESMLNALNGGYTAPSSGGDPVANPTALPTGRNLYAVNAEATPSEVAWDKGVTLVNATLDQYQKQHGTYPKKVSYTFWSSEFIETEGATIAQVLYMLGVEPVRDAFNRVSDLRLIPSEELGRPRIDVVVQTSGQFRDLAASRLALISRAVAMAAASKDDKYPNFVSQSTVDIEQEMVSQGVPPVEARELAVQRVFGGMNGMYGTGIQEMVKSGDKWDNEQELADTYLHNMSTVYGSQNDWGTYHKDLLRAVLGNTDIVIQPRQSNTWGALSLDHVFEFMGGLNMAVRNVTGKDPEAYFADYRNRNRVKMQELKESIGIESRSTILNPAYIREVMKGQASSAGQIAEVVTNTYGWNVMKPDVIDNELWEDIHNTYVRDIHNLGVQEFYRKNNPAAMQEITAVMLETARKGLWDAPEAMIAELAELHTELVKEFGASGTGFAGSNQKLQEFIAENTSAEKSSDYKKAIQQMRDGSMTVDVDASSGMVLKRETAGSEPSEKTFLNGIITAVIVLALFIGLAVLLRFKRKLRE